ncbi:hypothetical protein ACWCZ5_02545 [Streptomyces sp. NPDC001667]
MPGVLRTMARVGARDHTTFGGRLSPRPRGRFARAAAERGLDGDWRDFEQIRHWTHGIAANLLRAREAVPHLRCAQ